MTTGQPVAVLARLAGGRAQHDSAVGRCRPYDPPTVNNDDELLAACGRGDADAWRHLVEQHHRLVRSIAHSYGLYGDDSDEVVQVVFSVLVKQVDRFHPGTRLASWIGVVTRRHVWRILASRRREVVTEDAGSDRSHRDPDDIGQRSEDAAWLRDGLAKLPPRCRALLEALYLRGEATYADIAAELEMPLGSIGPTRARCLDRLRHLLEAADDERRYAHGH